MNPYIALTRPGNMVLTAIAVVAGAFIAAGTDISNFQIEILICCLCSMMLVGGGNALNDYNDRERTIAFSEGKPVTRIKKVRSFSPLPNISRRKFIGLGV